MRVNFFAALLFAVFAFSAFADDEIFVPDNVSPDGTVPLAGAVNANAPDGNSESGSGGGSGGFDGNGGGGDGRVKIEHEVRKMKGRKGYAHICLVLDASGSMSPFRDETVAACERFFKSQLKIAGEITLDIWTFGGNRIEKMVDFQRLRNKDYFKEYYCSGGTPCFDAVLKAADSLGAKIAKLAGNEAEHLRLGTPRDNPETVIFVVFTDGMDNESRARIGEVKNTISARSEQWNLLFIGTERYSRGVGLLMGFPDKNSFHIIMDNPADIKRIWDAIDDFSRRSRGVK